MKIVEENINEKKRIVLLKDGKTCKFEDSGIIMSTEELFRMFDTKKLWREDYYLDDSLYKRYWRSVKILNYAKYAREYQRKYGRLPPDVDPIPAEFKGKIMQSEQAVKLGLRDEEDR